jgi:hypothetical protein
MLYLVSREVNMTFELLICLDLEFVSLFLTAFEVN